MADKPPANQAPDEQLDPFDRVFNEDNPKFKYFEWEVHEHKGAGHWRDALNDSSLLPLERAAKALGGGLVPTRRWVRENVPGLRLPTGKVVYRLGDILRCLERVC